MGAILIFFGLAIIAGTFFFFDKEDVKYHGYENGSDLFFLLKIFGAPKWAFKLLLIILGILILSLGVLYCFNPSILRGYFFNWADYLKKDY